MSPSARSSRNRNGRRRNARPRSWPASRGGVSGFFGFAALPIELPVTTTLMLRAIADIARHHGEDLSTLEARLACVEVFALGSPRPQGRRTDIGYYAARALIEPARGRRHRAPRRAQRRQCFRAGRRRPGDGDRDAVRRRGVGALGGERAAGHRRRRRRHHQHDFHEPLSARRPRPFRHQAAGAPIRRRRRAPALRCPRAAPRARRLEADCCPMAAGLDPALRRANAGAGAARTTAPSIRVSPGCGACGRSRPRFWC